MHRYHSDTERGPGAEQAVSMSLGVYGTGRYKVYGRPGTYSFVVPVGVQAVRVRCVGAGESAGVFNAATDKDDKTAGGTSSFGPHMSAPGGGGGNPAGGIYRARGGDAPISYGGGGGAGSWLGPGGPGGVGRGAGGGGVFNEGGGPDGYFGGGGGSAVSGGGLRGAGGYSPLGVQAAPGKDGPVSADVIMRFPFDSFGGGGGGGGGDGLGGATFPGGTGGPGGGGGGGSGSASSQVDAGNGGPGGIGGGGGSGGTASANFGAGGPGGVGGGGGSSGGGSISKVAGAGGSWVHGEVTVVPEAAIQVVVGAGGVRAGAASGGHGVVVVEW